MTEILWQAVALVAVVSSWDAFRRWVTRDNTSIAALKRELDAMEKGWKGQFEHCDARVERMERAIVNIEPKFQPLGKHYSTRSS